MRVAHQEALELFQAAGAEISDGDRVRVPPEMVQRALETAPKSIAVYGRDGRQAMTLDGRRSHFGPGHSCATIADAATGGRRTAVLADLVRAVKLADRSPNLDFVMPLFLPADVPEATFERYQMEAMLAGTSKPILFPSSDAGSIRDAADMAAIAAGGREALQERPSVINLITLASPLEHDKGAVSGLLLSVERHLPVAYRPGPAADALDRHEAAQLTGLILSQLKREGSAFLWSAQARTAAGFPTTADGGATPNPGRLPSLGRAISTRAKLLDLQAAAEVTGTLLLGTVAGVDLTPGAGTLDSGHAGSLALIVLMDALVGWIRAETLGIEEGGDPPGQLWDQGSYEAWVEGGSMTLLQRVERHMVEILGRRDLEMLPALARHQIKGIIQRANASVRWTG